MKACSSACQSTGPSYQICRLRQSGVLLELYVATLIEPRCKLVYTPFGDVDQFSALAVDCYERALQEAQRNGTRVRALVIANPHNPLGMFKNKGDGQAIWLTVLGRCYPRDALEAIVRFCNKHDIHLISDEIYACSVYHTDELHQGFTSALSVNLTGINKGLVHVLYGFSKVCSII
jgi:aspartate/methionine/tyrosine aminotransferase